VAGTIEAPPAGIEDAEPAGAGIEAGEAMERASELVEAAARRLAERLVL